MGVLREKMIAEMKLRNFASRTQKSYLAVMVGLAKERYGQAQRPLFTDDRLCGGTSGH